MKLSGAMTQSKFEVSTGQQNAYESWNQQVRDGGDGLLRLGVGVMESGDVRGTGGDEEVLGGAEGGESVAAATCFTVGNGRRI